MRRGKAGRDFEGASCDSTELNADPLLKADYLVATPRMAYYMEYSARIVGIYLKYVAPEDIHVYSVDEVFIDVTGYLEQWKMTAREFVRMLIQEVLEATGITATAGIGPNLYLCKIAMDIWAKRSPADEYGVRIAELDEMSYRKALWNHRPLTDFWRVGKGIARKLEQYGMHTMGDVARCSVGKPWEIQNEELLYKLFGINAELLIDHAWGWEPCTMQDIKAYRAEGHSLSSGQVLSEPYPFEKARLVMREMADSLSLELVSKGLVTDLLVLSVGYDTSSLTDPEVRRRYTGPISTDFYGRSVPKAAHGSEKLALTSSTDAILDGFTRLFDRIVNPNLSVRRMYVVAGRVLPEEEAEAAEEYVQLDLFSDPAEQEAQRQQAKEERERERRRQEALLTIREKFGRNAILKGFNFEEGATAIQRNGQIGGHKA